MDSTALPIMSASLQIQQSVGIHAKPGTVVPEDRTLPNMIKLITLMCVSVLFCLHLIKILSRACSLYCVLLLQAILDWHNIVKKEYTMRLESEDAIANNISSCNLCPS